MPALIAGGLETEAGGLAIGRDPREMSRPELESLGHGEQPSEVRKCTAVRCANWPYRMGSDPFSDRKGNAASLHQKSPVMPGLSDDSPPAGRMMPGGSDGAGEDAVAGGGDASARPA